jgi:ubiquinone biosynthesis monooxygenase Coq7
MAYPRRHMHTPLDLSPVDRCLSSLENALRTVSGASLSSRPTPRPTKKGLAADGAATRGAEGHDTADRDVSDDHRRLSAALMRVNHVGEVCAQALYQAQALTARSPQLRAQMLAAAREETDHLVWTQERLRELKDRPSLLNPIWYAGSFAIGLVAGRLGDAASLGFVVETERQVEAHLASHLDRLPAADAASRAIVEQMKTDEARHAEDALAAGAATMPEPVKWVMRAAAKVMTTVAYRV